MKWAIFFLSVPLLSAPLHSLRFDSKLTINSVEVVSQLKEVEIIPEIVNATSVDVNVTLKDAIKGTLFLKAELWAEVGGKSQLMAKFPHFEFCKLLKNAGKLSVMKVMYKKLRQSTFMPLCPAHKGFYQLKGFFIEPEGLPFRLLPTGKYKLYNWLFTSDGDNVLQSSEIRSDMNFEKYI